MTVSSDLESLNAGFRRDFLDHDAMARQLRAWADAFPGFFSLRSLGRTPEGRDIWCAVIGRALDSVRPAVWVDANMHAVELSGSSVALAIAEDALRAHVDPAWDCHRLPETVREVLREVHWYVVPRISPDGAETVLKTGRWVRSVPRTGRPGRTDPHWVVQDVDGDGLSLTMRQRDPSGDFVESRRIPGLMVPRTLEDPGPFYRLFPEGLIENYDGNPIFSPLWLEDSSTDLNRNFPWGWAPEPKQAGAGAYSTSEPESRAVVELAARTPQLFAWLNLHTFGGVFIRPPGHSADTEMDPDDLALYRQLERWGEELCGYPMVSGFEEFTYTPGKPLHGDLTDFAYHQRGTLALVCELWDLFAELGMTRPKRFCDYYTQLGREDMEALAQWDQTRNHGRWLRPWRPCAHPQLGPVEVGGFDPRVGVFNPPLERLDELCTRQASLMFRVAAMAPRLELGEPSVRALGPGTFLVECEVRNLGYLPTYILASARELPFNEPLLAELLTEGCSTCDPAQARRAIGHLSGWGRGLLADSLLFPRSRGEPASQRLRWTVQGVGSVRIRVSGPRVGSVERRAGIGEGAPPANAR